MNRSLLLIDCTDKKGLIHDITGVLRSHNVNIETNQEFVDHSSGHFFMRTEFSGSFDSGKMYDDMMKILPPNSKVKLTGKRKKNILLMASKEHHCLGDILVKHSFNDINANILAVISNHEILRSITERSDLPFHFVSHENISREEHENKILNIINQYNPEYIVLAKYMRILNAEFTGLFTEKIINIHHSFLPAFIGANPYKQAYERGVKIIGATAHFVNHNLDEGPIISQDVININHTMNAEDMARAGRDVEKSVLSKALKLVFDDKVMVNGNKTVVFD
ncbi:MAG TPA: formyltetrahydrofolate deformylase [Spirochaetota bacterium]|jgi:formyltetrahydrofolate deformylase|nr:formyltetrahydrofolate deformylase [Spirochaetota bacterium]HPJ13909.1 formyltetrahydrofolate deformylase [Spirochaetota bacterium]HPY04353.1 formyltetrahydrofolate deformylase [Spirochaetota bacterium]HQA53652.1 formyltetrahydrofolate deformylase [Spirochaetota bacterium]